MVLRVSRDGLAGVEHLGLRPGDLLDELVRERRDAAHALEQVEDDALGREECRGLIADDGDGLALLHLDPVEDLGVTDDLEPAGGVADSGEGLEEDGNAAQPRDDTCLFGDDGSGRPQGWGDGEGRRDIVRCLVLGERRFENGANPLALPVHAVILTRGRASY
jgi:hypothetical protein